MAKFVMATTGYRISYNNGADAIAMLEELCR